MTKQEERDRRIESLAALSSYHGYVALRELLEKKREKLRDEIEAKPDEHKGGRACEIRDILRMVENAAEEVRTKPRASGIPSPIGPQHAYDAV